MDNYQAAMAEHVGRLAHESALWFAESKRFETICGQQRAGMAELVEQRDDALAEVARLQLELAEVRP